MTAKGAMAPRDPTYYIGVMLFPPFQPDSQEPWRRRFRPIPVRTLVPNVITLLALCAGLTAIRLAVEDKLEFALAGIVFAAVLDGVDGRVARLIKGTSRFGAELDSLADFVNFGVAPGLILYFWSLHELKSVGWIAAMVFAICAALRLARFNVAIDDPNRPTWAGNFFVGVPAPAGAIVVLLPIYLHFLGLPQVALVTFVYTVVVALLMVSRLPVFSGKKLSTRVPREMVLPVLVLAVLFVALLMSYPWLVLTTGTVTYLVCLPFGWMAYRRLELAALHDGASEQMLELPSSAANDARPAGPGVTAHPEKADENRACE
jgi:CDP-diacylglycerol--serine O-phosphatidyltransferase